MPKIKVKYQNGILIPLEKIDLKEGEILEVEIKDLPSKKLSKYIGIVKKKDLNMLEEAYHDYVVSRTSFR